MTRRTDDAHQPKLGHTAADLGEEAYQANLSDTAGRDGTHPEHNAGTVPQWKHPEARNSPPGQHRKDAAEVKIGQDWKTHGEGDPG